MSLIAFSGPQNCINTQYTDLSDVKYIVWQMLWQTMQTHSSLLLFERSGQGQVKDHII